MVSKKNNKENDDKEKPVKKVRSSSSTSSSSKSTGKSSSKAKVAKVVTAEKKTSKNISVYLYRLQKAPLEQVLRYFFAICHHVFSPLVKL